MRQLWHQWFLDNPFLIWDLRRRLRKGYLWKVALGGVVLPSLILILSLALLQFGPEWLRASVARKEGLALFIVLSFVHVAVAMTFSSGSMTLIAEAAADRLDFLRLTPRGRRELMLLMGLGRAVIRLVPLILPLPLYGLLLSFGKLQPEDVLGLYVLLSLFLFAPPNTLEITSALGTRHGMEAGTGKAAGGQAAAGITTGLAWPIMLQVILHLVIKPVIVPLARVFSSGWQGAVGPDLGGWMPLALLAALARIVGSPQTFFHGHLAPFLPLLLCTALALWVRVLVGAELWSRECRVVPQGVGRVDVALAPETGRPEERRLADRVAGVNTLFAALMLAGFSWPIIQRGALGKLVGSTTPEGSLVGLFVLFGGGYAIYAWERASRSGGVAIHGPFGALRMELTDWIRGVVMGALVLGAAGLIGGVMPGARAVEILARLLAVGALAVFFGTAWQAFVRRAVPDATTEGEFSNGGAWRIGGMLLWVAVYAGPLAALSLGGSKLVWHALAGWSPVYGILALVPGIWPSKAPLPLAAQLLMPLIAGGILWVLAPRSQRAPVEARPRRQDRLERWLAARADQFDNPFVTLALTRMARKPTGFGAQVGLSVGFYLTVSIVLAIALLSGYSGRRGLSFTGVLFQPTPFGEMTVGALGALIGAGGGLLMLVQFWPTAIVTQVQAEHLKARTQGRIPFLYLTGISDESAVKGVIGTGMIAGAPFLIGFAITSLIWLIAAIALEAHPAWSLFWLLGLVAAILQGLSQGLRTFELWRLERKLREKFWTGLTQVVSFLAWMGLIPLMVFLAMTQKVRVDHLILGYASLQLAATLYALIRLKSTFKRAVGAVHASRHEADLERVS